MAVAKRDVAALGCSTRRKTDGGNIDHVAGECLRRARRVDADVDEADRVTVAGGVRVAERTGLTGQSDRERRGNPIRRQAPWRSQTLLAHDPPTAAGFLIYATLIKKLQERTILQL